MEGIRVVPRESDPAPEEPSARRPEEPRSRLRRALLCPYCRDEVPRRGALLCARRGCGALYHRECWDECSTQYGGCAVYGCSSKKSLEVSRRGYVLRLARLLVAAVLFPKRVVRALETFEGPPVPGQIRGVNPPRGFAAITAATRESLRTLFNTRTFGGAVVLLSLVAGLIVSPFYFVVIMGMADSMPAMSNQDYLSFTLAAFAGFVVPVLLALLGAGVGIHALRAIASVLEGELGALKRADEGATVLGRLRRGDGKK